MDTSSARKSNLGQLTTTSNVRVALAMADACSAPDLRLRHLASAETQLAALQAECEDLARACAALRAELAVDAQAERQASLFDVGGSSK